MLTFTLIKQLIITTLAFSVIEARPLAEEIDANGIHGERHTEPFGLVSIRSGSDLQYQSVVISHGQLFLSGNSTDPYAFNGVLYWDGGIKILPDASRFQPESVNDDLYLSVSNSSTFITSPYRQTSFSIRDGRLNYRGEEGVYAVPDNRFGYQYSLSTSGDADGAIGIGLRAFTQSGGSPGNYPSF